jgi:uncharacterized protein YwgA
MIIQLSVKNETVKEIKKILTSSNYYAEDVDKFSKLMQVSFEEALEEIAKGIFKTKSYFCIPTGE